MELMNELRTFLPFTAALDWRFGCRATGKGCLAGLTVEPMRLPEHCCPSGFDHPSKVSGIERECGGAS